MGKRKNSLAAQNALQEAEHLHTVQLGGSDGDTRNCKRITGGQIKVGQRREAVAMNKLTAFATAFQRVPVAK